MDFLGYILVIKGLGWYNIINSFKNFPCVVSQMSLQFFGEFLSPFRLKLENNIFHRLAVAGGEVKILFY